MKCLGFILLSAVAMLSGFETIAGFSLFFAVLVA